jgi:tRNA(Arg) A34 adenosine deaminase TadA
MTNDAIQLLALKKASQSSCRFKVSAIGFNRKGDLIGTAVNQHRISKPGCSIHAEIALIKKMGRNLSTIIICRTNKTGGILPIHPCKTCANIASRYGIVIKTIGEINEHKHKVEVIHRVVGSQLSRVMV